MGSLLRTLVSLALCGVAAAGCCIGSEEQCRERDDPSDCEGDLCEKEVIATPGCPVDGIDERSSEFCADCGEREICGAPQVAFCGSLERADGTACSLCVVEETGEVLYDGCYAGAGAPAHDDGCEVTPPSGDAPASLADSTCLTCFADSALVDTRFCGPLYDACVDVMDGATPCRECTIDGELAFRTCAAPDIAPAVCQVYADEDGRCVDCFDETGAFLSHQCTLTDDLMPVACLNVVAPEGITCEMCWNAAGQAISQTCFETPGVEDCGLFFFEEETCVVCVDANNELISQVCEPVDCDDASDECPKTDGCTSYVGEDGSYCRTCVDPEGGDPVEQCFDTDVVNCEYTGAPPPGEDEPEGSECLVCFDGDTGQQIFETCEPLGTSTLVCAVDGLGCRTCYHPDSLVPVFQACDGSGDSCFDDFDVALSYEGVDIVVDQGGGIQDVAVADCSACYVNDGDGAAEALQARCALSHLCSVDEEWNGGGELPPDSQAFGAQCPVGYIVEIAPLQCENPWTPAPDEDHGMDDSLDAQRADLTALLAYAFAHDVELLSAERIADVEVDSCGDGCGACPRGDAIALAVVDEQAALAAIDLFGALAVSSMPVGGEG